MELHRFDLHALRHLIGRHHWSAREPDWFVGGLAGCVAGALLMALELALTSFASLDPWRTPRLVAALLLGNPVLGSGGYARPVVVAALVVHFFLGTLFGLVLAGLMAPFRFDSSLSMACAVGAVYGTLLYLFDLYVIAGMVPWVAELRGWPVAAAHVLFGVFAAGLYRLARRR
jgi:hypothetical protein